jgi:hypothetical protein
MGEDDDDGCIRAADSVARFKCVFGLYSLP